MTALVRQAKSGARGSAEEPGPGDGDEVVTSAQVSEVRRSSPAPDQSSGAREPALPPVSGSSRPPRPLLQQARTFQMQMPLWVFVRSYQAPERHAPGSAACWRRMRLHVCSTADKKMLDS